MEEVDKLVCRGEIGRRRLINLLVDIFPLYNENDNFLMPYGTRHLCSRALFRKSCYHVF